MNNILISAIVALVVSLGTEWFAKPWLEARKERILERHRNIRRAAIIVLDADRRRGERIDTGRDTYKPEHVDEFRSLQHEVASLWGKRDREAGMAMINAFLYAGLDPIYPSLDDHPRSAEEDFTLANWAAHFLLTPRYRIRQRRMIHREMKRHLDKEAPLHNQELEPANPHGRVRRRRPGPNGTPRT